MSPHSILTTAVAIVVSGAIDITQMVRQVAVETPLSGVAFLFYFIAAGLTLTLVKEQRQIGTFEKNLKATETVV